MCARKNPVTGLGPVSHSHRTSASKIRVTAQGPASHRTSTASLSTITTGVMTGKLERRDDLADKRSEVSPIILFVC